MSSFNKILNKVIGFLESLFGKYVGPGDIGKKNPVEIWVGPSDHDQITGMIGDDKLGLFVCLSGSFKGQGYKSQIWRFTGGNFDRIYSGNQETIGQPSLIGDEIHFPVEHGSNHLVYKNGGIQNGKPTKGRWSISSGVVNGRVLIPYNNNYTGRFNDSPVLVDGQNGNTVKNYSAKFFPRSIFEHNGEIVCMGNYNEKVMYVGDKKYNTLMLKGGSKNGKIYGGGGVDAGPSGVNDGRIFEWSGGKEKEIGKLGGQSCEYAYNDDGRVLLAFINPDELVEISKNGSPRIICSLGQSDRKYKGGWAFGVAVAKYKDKFYFGRSDNSRTHLYRLD